MGAGANSLARNYGQDVAGIAMQKLAPGMLHGAGGAARSMGMASGAMGGVGQQPDDSDMTSRFINDQSPQSSLEQGRGFALTEAALDAMRNDPQALGPYLQQIAQAAGSREPDAVSALITRLSRTDPNFRTQVLPALRARTGGM